MICEHGNGDEGCYFCKDIATWKIRFAYPDGSGTAHEYIKAHSMTQAMGRLKELYGLNDGNFISCVDCGETDTPKPGDRRTNPDTGLTEVWAKMAAPKKTFTEWFMEKYDETPNMSPRQEAFIRWIEETR